MLVLLLGSACTSRFSSGDVVQDDAGSTSTEASVGEGGSYAEAGGESTQADGDATTHNPGEATSSSGPPNDGDASTTGEVVDCQLTTCQGKIYECGDCLDNDGDGRIDAADPACWGPCDNNESGWYAQIPTPGPTGMECYKADCYFDQDSGSGNDGCYWALSCDPLEPLSCTYDADIDIPGTSMSCEEAAAMQTETCADVCGPVVPNGCDCFGCCNITWRAETYTVYLGSYELGQATCGPETIADPELCHPCTQVSACLNPCEPEHCEICIGQTTLPDGCEQAGCPEGVQPCLPEHESGDCPAGMACITGCCIPFLD
jgi:hypothetical protein